jgi:Rhs element Vgr protein
MNEVVLTNSSSQDVISFDIMVDETAIDPAYQVLAISVHKEANRIPMAKIIIRDGEASERTFAISNTDVFIPGKKIRIKVGRDSNNEQVFQGIIVRHAIKVKQNGHSELQIECRDEAVRMTVGRHSRYFENVKDSDVFDDLVRNYKGIKTESKSTGFKHKELVQHNISDWDFLLLRAEANSMLVMADDGVLKIAKPDTAAKPVTQVTYGSSVSEFEAEIDAQVQWKKVKAVSWDYSNQQLFKADASSSSLNEPGNITGTDLAKVASPDQYELHHSGHLLQQELQDWVDGTMTRSRLAKIRGRVKFAGFAGIRPGNMVQLEGVGDRFKGKAFVTSVRHDIGKGTWDTHIQFGLDPTRYAFVHHDMNEAAAAGLVGAIKGLQIGKVVQLQDDPDGEHRIRVKVPVISNDARGTWMRVSTLDAGADRGSFFRPEIDDEVVVGFINDDPRDAIVLGMLHSSARSAPITARDVNHEKGFTTRSRMHLSFDDNDKKITIDTPGGNSIVLDESGMKIVITDQNSNKITMDTAGIKIESPFNVDITAGVNLSLKAGASLTIGGAALSVKADGSVSIEGAMAKLAGQGMTEITGAMVKIN